MKNKQLIQIEGLAVMVLGIYMYFTNGYSWGVFVLGLFVPDLCMIGYLINKKTGAFLYNLCHTYSFPLLLLLIGSASSMNTLVWVSLIWITHIGLDRMMGYGLKYPTGFKDTHIQRL